MLLFILSYIYLILTFDKESGSDVKLNWQHLGADRCKTIVIELTHELHIVGMRF